MLKSLPVSLLDMNAFLRLPSGDGIPYQTKEAEGSIASKLVSNRRPDLGRLEAEIHARRVTVTGIYYFSLIFKQNFINLDNLSIGRSSTPFAAGALLPLDNVLGRYHALSVFRKQCADAKALEAVAHSRHAVSRTLS